jgi:osmoprotectant transport system permease protein
MGYPRDRRLWRIELPLAIPLVFAGVRLATVSTIGLVTVTAILGDRFGGLGFFILEGYRHSFPTEILFGAIPSILLAVGADLLLVRLEGRMTPWRNPSIETPRAAT